MASIKTITLSGKEQKVSIAGANCAIRNDGTSTVYAAVNPNVTAGADGVLSIAAGSSAVLLDTRGEIYLLGSGAVQIYGSNYTENPFKVVNAGGGTGGDGVDEIARAAITSHVENSTVHVTADEKASWDSKADGEHNHDDRYYTETEINRLLKNKANLSDIPTSLPASDVYEWAKAQNKPTYTAEEVGALPDTVTSLPANGGNADTVGGKSASEFSTILNGNRTVYVSTAGSDTNGSGSEASPWATIQKAVDECPQATSGKNTYTIVVAGGNYSETVTVVGKNGTIEIKNTGTVSVTGIEVRNSPYVVLSGSGQYKIGNTSSLKPLSVYGSSTLLVNASLVIAASSADESAACIRLAFGSTLVAEYFDLVFKLVGRRGVLAKGAARAFLPTLTGTLSESGIHSTYGSIISYEKMSWTAPTDIVAEHGGRVYTGVQE